METPLHGTSGGDQASTVRGSGGAGAGSRRAVDAFDAEHCLVPLSLAHIMRHVRVPWAHADPLLVGHRSSVSLALVELYAWVDAARSNEEHGPHSWLISLRDSSRQHWLQAEGEPGRSPPEVGQLVRAVGKVTTDKFQSLRLLLYFFDGVHGGSPELQHHEVAMARLQAVVSGMAVQHEGLADTPGPRNPEPSLPLPRKSP